MSEGRSGWSSDVGTPQSEGTQVPTRGGPLTGVCVLDLSSLLAGPMAGMYLADFGAEVIKVEDPRKGDELRRWGLSRDGTGLMFKVVNRNKRCVTLDLRQPEGQAIARKLAIRSDVVIENFRPGTLERWGLGFDALSALNPKLIMLRVSGYGQTGPYAQRRGFGTIGEAFSGFAAMNGEEGGGPLLPSFGLGDTSTALFGALGVVLALTSQATTGQGQVVDLGLYEGLLTLLGSYVIDYDQLGVVHERSGSRLPFAAPRNVYRTADGRWLVIAGSTQRTFEAIVAALGLEGLAQDQRFATNASRLANVRELDRILASRLLELRAEEAVALLEAAGAPVVLVHDIRSLLEDPHVLARGNVVGVEDPELGRVRVQNVAPRLTGTPGAVQWLGRTAGADNDFVYRKLLGMEPKAIDGLRRQGVI